MMRTAFRAYQPGQAKYNRRITAAEWQRHRNKLRLLHEQGLSRSQILAVMRLENNFIPSMSQLNAIFGRWGLKSCDRPLRPTGLQLQQRQSQGEPITHVRAPEAMHYTYVVLQNLDILLELHPPLQSVYGGGVDAQERCYAPTCTHRHNKWHTSGEHLVFAMMTLDDAFTCLGFGMLSRALKFLQQVSLDIHSSLCNITAPSVLRLLRIVTIRPHGRCLDHKRLLLTFLSKLSSERFGQQHPLTRMLDIFLHTAGGDLPAWRTSIWELVLERINKAFVSDNQLVCPELSMIETLFDLGAYRDVITRCSEALGRPNLPLGYRTVLNYWQARCYDLQKDFYSAQKLYEELRQTAAYPASLPDCNHNPTHDASHLYYSDFFRGAGTLDLANLHYLHFRFDEALRLYKETFDIFHTVVGPVGTHCLIVLKQWLDCLYRKGDAQAKIDQLKIDYPESWAALHELS